MWAGMGGGLAPIYGHQHFFFRIGNMINHEAIIRGTVFLDKADDLSIANQGG